MNGINGFYTYQYNYIPNVPSGNTTTTLGTMGNRNAEPVPGGNTGVHLTLSFGRENKEDGKVTLIGKDTEKVNPMTRQKENIDLPGIKNEKDSQKEEECETCKNRKYVDGSDENVSFKSAQHISPESAAARVRAHEGEHVANAYAKAAKQNGEVVRASVSIHTDICDECGKVYVSGGTTHTTIRYPNEQPQEQEMKQPENT